MFYRIFWLVFAHFLGDYALQSSWVAQMKRKDNYVLFAHSIIWTGTIALFLTYFDLLTIWKLLFLLFGHFICDYLKCRFSEVKRIWIYDQIFHFIQLLVCFF